MLALLNHGHAIGGMTGLNTSDDVLEGLATLADNKRVRAAFTTPSGECGVCISHGGSAQGGLIASINRIAQVD